MNPVLRKNDLGWYPSLHTCLLHPKSDLGSKTVMNLKELVLEAELQLCFSELDRDSVLASSWSLTMPATSEIHKASLQHFN